MSAMAYVTIWCDESQSSELMACGEYVESDTAAEARKIAKRAGWAVNRPSGDVGRGGSIKRDYCPRHVPKSQISGASDA